MNNYDLKNTLSSNKLAALWRLMTGFRWLYIVASISVAIAALGRTASYYVVRFFVDDVLQAENRLGLIPYVAAAFIGLALAQGVFTYLGGRLAAQTSEGIVRRLRNYLYDHMQRLTFTYHDRMQTGDLLSRATSDVDTLRRLFSEQLIGIGRLVSLFAVSFLGLLLLHVRLAFYSVIIIPLVIALSIYFFRKMEATYQAYQEQEATLSSRLQENLTGVRVVKAFARQRYEIDRFEDENSKKYRRGSALINLHSAFWPSTDILCGIQMLAGFYIGARMAIAGEISVGTYLAYAGLVIQLIWPIRNLGRLVAQISTGFVSLERIQQIIGQVREPLDEGSYRPAGRVIGEIEFNHVSFAYDTPAASRGMVTNGQTRRRIDDTPLSLDDGMLEPAQDAAPSESALHDINLHVEPGQTIGILGATGSGKTTLVNLLPRFYEYSEGSITLDGVELRDYSRSYLRQEIGIVQQEPFLFSASIRENIAYGVGRDVTDEEIEVAARAAAVHDVIVTFPRGYDSMVGERGVTLSGGQKQRVTLARCLLKNPSILILDDATSSVDTETDAAIREALQRLMDNRTTFIIAHRVQSVMDADLILVMDEGRIVQRGTHRDLVQQPGIYRRVYDLQARIESDLAAEIAQAVDAADKQLDGRSGRAANRRERTISAGEEREEIASEDANRNNKSDNPRLETDHPKGTRH